MTRINLEGVSTGFEPLPSGIYAAELAGYKMTTVKQGSKNAGADMVVLEFNFTEDGYENRKAWRNYPLVKDAYWAFKQAVIRLGADPDRLEEEVEVEDVLEELVGNRCRLQVTLGSYNNKPKNDIEVMEDDYGI